MNIKFKQKEITNNETQENGKNHDEIQHSDTMRFEKIKLRAEQFKGICKSRMAICVKKMFAIRIIHAFKMCIGTIMLNMVCIGKIVFYGIAGIPEKELV